MLAGIVQKAEDYLYSSARNYTGKPGLIPVTVLEGIYTAGNWKSGGWPGGGCNSGGWQSGGCNVVG